MTPEELARRQIDALLEGAGWVLQNNVEFNRNAGEGVAVREFSLPNVPGDYLLFIAERPSESSRPRRRESPSAASQNSLPNTCRNSRNTSPAGQIIWSSTTSQREKRPSSVTRVIHSRVHAASSHSISPKRSTHGSKSPDTLRRHLQTGAAARYDRPPRLPDRCHSRTGSVAREGSAPRSHPDGHQSRQRPSQPAPSVGGFSSSPWLCRVPVHQPDGSRHYS